MNEILGPIYYIFASDPDEDFKRKEPCMITQIGNAEADTFFCFTNLMAEIRDNFIKTLDKSSIGVTGQLQRLNSLLRKKDPEIHSSFVIIETLSKLLIFLGRKEFEYSILCISVDHTDAFSRI